MDVSEFKMEDDRRNEKLRQQIQILTDMIENAKSQKSSAHYQNFKKACAVHQPPVNAATTKPSQHWKSSQFQNKSSSVKVPVQSFQTYTDISAKPVKHRSLHCGKSKSELSVQYPSVTSEVGLKDVVRETNPQLLAGKQSQVFVNNASTSHQYVNTSLKSKPDCTADPEKLQREIVKMHQKIAEIQKSLSQKCASLAQGKHVSNKVGAISSPEKLATAKTITSKPDIHLSKHSINSSHIDNHQLKQEPVSTINQTHSSKVSNSSLKHTGEVKPGTSIIGMGDSDNKSDGELVSISKYKLARIGSSPIKSSTVISFSQPLPASESRPNILDGGNSSSTGARQECRTENFYINEETFGRTPAKFVAKSKYSITRVRHSGKKMKLDKAFAKSNAKTPAKFVKFSKYAIKRIRRSLSGESEQSRKPSKDGSFITGTQHKLDFSKSETSTCQVVRSKFKMEKVYSKDDSLINYKSYERWNPSNVTGFVRKGYTSGRHHAFSHTYLHQNNYLMDWKQPRRKYVHQKFWYFKQDRHSLKGHYRHHRNGRHQYLPNLGYTRRSAISQKYLQRRLQLLKQRIPFNSKLKLDKRKGPVTQPGPAAVNFLMINGMLYKSNSKTLIKATPAPRTQSQRADTPSNIKKLGTSSMKTVTVRGVKFRVDRRGKSLKRLPSPEQDSNPNGSKETATSSLSHISRVDIGGEVYVQTQPGTLERVGSAKSRIAATRVVNRTVHRAAAKYKKDNTKVTKKKKYCMFYNRFGKCNRKEKCPYIHDPEKVAVCTRFLRGTCGVKDCLFSHKVSQDKMPVCSYFLKGVCSKDGCPYLHVNVNKDAEICGDFLKGYCPLKGKCKKKHVLQCPEFDRTGNCAAGEKCKLQHRKLWKRKEKLLFEEDTHVSKRLKIQEETKPSTSQVLDDISALLSNSQNNSQDSKHLGTFKLETEKDNDAVGLQNVAMNCDSNVCSDRNTPISTALSYYTGLIQSEVNSRTLLFKEKKLPAYISLKTDNNRPQSVPDIQVLEVQQHVKDNSERPVMKIRPQL